MSSFRFVDLFAGVGGFHHALTAGEFGGECVLAVELDRECRRVYSEAFPETPQVSDIRSITRRPDGRDSDLSDIAALVPDHEVLCAGFPCQPFSKSGDQLGVLDQTRGTLFFDIMAIARAKRPEFLLLENVPNLIGPRHQHTWETIVAAIREAGYGITSRPVILSPHRLAPPLGAPQIRERVFILAARDHRVLNGSAPLIDRSPDPTWQPSRWRVGDFLKQGDQGEPYRLRPIERTWLAAWEAFVRGVDEDRLPGFPIWVDAWMPEPAVDSSMPPWKVDFIRKNSAFYVRNRSFLDGWLRESWDASGTTVADFPLSRRKFEWQARAVQPTRKDRSLWKLLIHLRPSGIRVKPPTYFPALVAITQTPIVGWLERRITPEEASILQGIPIEPFRQAGVDDATIYRQLGNAVNVGAVQFAAATLFAHAGRSWGASIKDRPLRLTA